MRKVLGDIIRAWSSNKFNLYLAIFYFGLFLGSVFMKVVLTRKFVYSDLLLPGIYLVSAGLFLWVWRIRNGQWRSQPRKSRRLRSHPPHPSPSLVPTGSLTWPSQSEVSLSRPPSQISSRPSVKEIRKLPSPVVGFRVWTLGSREMIRRNASGIGLFPLNITYGEWNPGVNTAKCNLGPDNDHRPAEEGCGCGYWIKDSLRAAEGHRAAYNQIVGIVAGWGRVQIHLDGWRCQHATPLAFAWDEDFITHGSRMAFGDLVNMSEAIKIAAMQYDVPLLGSHVELGKWYLANTER